MFYHNFLTYGTEISACSGRAQYCLLWTLKQAHSEGKGLKLSIGLGGASNRYQLQKQAKKRDAGLQCVDS